MGFFDLKVECAICNNEAGLNRYQIADKKWICPSCFKKCGFNMMTPIKKMTVEDIQAAMRAKEANEDELNAFNATKKIGSMLHIDENQKKWIIPDGFTGKVKKAKVYDYSDIVDFELLEDGESITKGGLGRAAVGGVLFGGVGAIVGGATGKKKSKPVCTNLKIKITLNDMKNPVVYLNFISSETKKDSLIYKNMYNTAQECLSTLQLICNSVEAPAENSDKTISSADEILKFKNLLDSGVISQEEFEAKKKQLLGL